jgi:hypothetical protein
VSKVDWEMDRSGDMLGWYGRSLRLMVMRSVLVASTVIDAKE